MGLLRSSIPSVLMLCALVKEAAGASDGFLGTGLSFGADLGIVIGGGVLIIIIIVSVLCAIYCCTRKKDPKGKEKNRADHVYPEDRDGVQGWRLPNSQVQMFGELPDVPVEEGYSMPALAQLPLEMQPIPANYPPSQLQTPEDEMPQMMPPQGQMFQQFPSESMQGQRMAGRPTQPIEIQPYHGALESSISPFLAQSAIAAELAEKGKSKKKKERSEVEGPISLYDGPPPPMAPNPRYTNYNQTSPHPPVASGYAPPYTADANAAQGGNPAILAEPRSSQGYPLGYQSFLPQLAAAQPRRTTPSNPPYTQSVYSMSNRLDDAPPGQQRYGSEGGSRQLGRGNYPTPAQPQGNTNRNRIDPYDYMLH